MKHTDTIGMLIEALKAQPDNDKLRGHIVQLMTEDNDFSQLAAMNMGEQEMMEVARKTITAQPELAISLSEKVLEMDKANAEAYMIVAKAHRELGDLGKAYKFYSIAVVIDERLENPEFEDLSSASAGVESKAVDPTETDNDSDTPEDKTTVERPKVPAMLSQHGENISEEVVDSEDFVETDPALDALLNQDLIDFTDVGGMEALKERIRMSIIYPFKNKELFKKFKKKMGGGILMYGPPGCGKTLIAKATAGECGAHFMNISIHDILSKWIGESEQRVHQLFETARRKSPTIIFIDEIDAMCIKRSDAGHTASLVNMFLTEIDGATSNNEDVLVIGATNTPWRIDSAFRRPGRFDHVLFVPPPDLEARESIFELALNDVPQEKIDAKKLAKLSEKFSGADIVATVTAAGEEAIQEIMRTGKEIKVSEKVMVKAVKKHRPTTLEWLEQAANYASYANQSGLYDELAKYIKG